MNSISSATLPRSPATMRTRLQCWSRTGMKSISVAAPVAVSNRVSRMSVSSRYFRVTEYFPAGAIFQRPCSERPSRAAKHAGASKRGQHSQSIEPSRPISAALWQSPTRA
jgi:hypothetical protein